MARQELYVVAQAVADSVGDIVLTFPSVPQGLTWTGSITAAVNQTSNVVATVSPAPLFGATWTITINSVPFMSFQGLEVVEDFQATGRQSVVVNGFGLVPNTSVIMTWTGFSDDTYNVERVGTSVSGMAGDWSRIFSGGGSYFAGITPPLVQLQSKSLSAPSSAVTVIDVSTLSGNANKVLYLLSYTLGSSLAQLAATAGTHGMTTSLQIFNIGLGSTVLDQVIPLVSPGGEECCTVSQSFLSTPLPLGPAPSTDIQLITGPSSADNFRAWCSVLVGYI